MKFLAIPVVVIQRLVLEGKWFSYKGEVIEMIAYNSARRINTFLNVRILTTDRSRSQDMFIQKRPMTTARGA